MWDNKTLMEICQNTRGEELALGANNNSTKNNNNKSAATFNKRMSCVRYELPVPTRRDPFSVPFRSDQKSKNLFGQRAPVNNILGCARLLWAQASWFLFYRLNERERERRREGDSEPRWTGTQDNHSAARSKRNCSELSAPSTTYARIGRPQVVALREITRR